MADLRDEYGNPIQLTDEHGNPVELTDEHGNPVHITGVATSKPPTLGTLMENEVPATGLLASSNGTDHTSKGHAGDEENHRKEEPQPQPQPQEQQGSGEIERSSTSSSSSVRHIYVYLNVINQLF